MPLRDYQQAAFDAAKGYLSRCLDPCVIDAATGAGKSHIIAALSEWSMTQFEGKTLCLAPSKELVDQNYAKFLATGYPASIYSASAGRKCVRHDVIFGTPKTVQNAIDRFPPVSLVVIDEAHGITPTIQLIISSLHKKTDQLRVIGLTATPYRTGEGYIYQYDPDENKVDSTRDPYFHQCIYQIATRDLIERGYLTPVNHSISDHTYDTQHLEQDRFGRYDSKQVEQAFEGQGRLTSEIVKDIVRHSQDRQGVLIFAATVKHANEVLESLPSNSEIITGNTRKKEREAIIAAFKRQQIKYLVNVSVLTTGFDAPHIDVVALLRATESPGLLQQMIGRGLRLSEGKTDCLVLDYAENLERHCPDGDIFDPQLSQPVIQKDAELIKVECPLCKTDNTFKARPNPDRYKLSKNGYFVDLNGEPITELIGEKEVPIPSHYGRRCQGKQYNPDTMHHDDCLYRWVGKNCPECEEESDIAARACEHCGAELVDPNDKLRIEFARIKADPYQVTTDKVLDVQFFEHVSLAGNETVRADWTTDQSAFTIWYMPSKSREWATLSMAMYRGKVAPTTADFLKYLPRAQIPETITACRIKGSKFWKVYSYNQPESKCEV